MEKKLKFNSTPDSLKKVNYIKNPDNYKEYNVCWQFSLMDFDSKFGWQHAVNRVNFSSESKESILLELAELQDSESIYSAIDDIPIRSFNNSKDFFKKLESIDTIKVGHLNCLLGRVKENYFWEELVPKLRNFESVKWKEIEKETFGKKGKSKHHWVTVDKIIKEARERLEYLKLDDYQELYSIRLTGKIRIWGIREFNFFRLLWFDEEHEICPSILD
jgi:hypothetical protein